ncbi:MAG TPA: hypothetical protein VFR33_00980 [Candidatus Dormibacteraeota bacterium]|nr:hypothetical protein [Candidatus Dormibacteraeota bacterium]
MNWAALRGEWGAVTFVLTVVAGMIVVPLALYFANVSPGAIATPTISTTSSARSSSIQSASSANTTSPAASPSASPSH